MNKYFIAKKYLPIALALAAFTAAGAAPALAQQSGPNARPIVHKQYGVAVPSSVERPDAFGLDGWFNR
jgi:hypothetical protein